MSDYEQKDNSGALFSNAENYIENLLEKMGQLEFWKNSIILVTSDHGISVGEKFGERAYGAFCYDYTIKTFAYYSNCYKESKLVKQQIQKILNYSLMIIR